MSQTPRKLRSTSKKGDALTQAERALALLDRTPLLRARDLVDAGIAREVARMVLPVSIYSSAYVTVNARSLMNFLSLRRKADDSHFPSYPQREIEMVAERYEEEFERLMPLTHAAFVANGRVAP